MKRKILTEIAYHKLLSELQEDLGGDNLDNDISTKIFFRNSYKTCCIISNREDMVLCGAEFVEYFLKKKFPTLLIKLNFSDGKFLKKNTKIFVLEGNCKIILALERTVLNFLQHLSSISTFTEKISRQFKNTKTKLLDTRKTTMGLRRLEKYATNIGGAENHRFGLYDKILIKDNHIKMIGEISKVLGILKKSKKKNVMVECDTFNQASFCLRNGIRYILLDNMKINQIKKCIEYKNKYYSNTKIEITGGINSNNIKKYIFLGADYISTSSLTNCSKSVDIGLDIL